MLPELEDYKGRNGQAPLENATEWKQGGSIVKTIVVKNKLVNLIVK